ncbi:MAG: hypothetical protein OXD49_17935 [Candidatus Poribacteria bacterium]|nr:hypothetical protein [Candidatus Poribacteria bacterium]
MRIGNVEFFMGSFSRILIPLMIVVMLFGCQEKDVENRPDPAVELERDVNKSDLPSPELVRDVARAVKEETSQPTMLDKSDLLPEVIRTSVATLENDAQSSKRWDWLGRYITVNGHIEDMDPLKRGNSIVIELYNAFNPDEPVSFFVSRRAGHKSGYETERNKFTLFVRSFSKSRFSHTPSYNIWTVKATPKPAEKIDLAALEKLALAKDKKYIYERVIVQATVKERGRFTDAGIGSEEYDISVEVSSPNLVFKIEVLPSEYKNLTAGTTRFFDVMITSMDFHEPTGNTVILATKLQHE